MENESLSPEHHPRESAATGRFTSLTGAVGGHRGLPSLAPRLLPAGESSRASQEVRSRALVSTEPQGTSDASPVGKLQMGSPPEVAVKVAKTRDSLATLEPVGSGGQVAVAEL